MALSYKTKLKFLVPYLGNCCRTGRCILTATPDAVRSTRSLNTHRAVGGLLGCAAVGRSACPAPQGLFPRVAELGEVPEDFLDRPGLLVNVSSDEAFGAVFVEGKKVLRDLV